ncbi:hypothetical protein CDL15_Pgr018336 [Punica granatum]|uniref:Uncharacterized protein n=1 Tax=Punica granatum TaxID=22663 RepID=A0A218WJP5_PUNGR|nr:hypothetical protein CDL15_Pgr018336 [Punica granatum]PKI49791.1 hypothetical protein CRG98_029840 [Punica granatum]
MKRFCPMMILLFLMLIAGNEKAIVDGANCRDRLQVSDCEKNCDSSCKEKHGNAATGACIFFHDPNRTCWCSFPCPSP